MYIKIQNQNVIKQVVYKRKEKKGTKSEKK